EREKRRGEERRLRERNPVVFRWFADDERKGNKGGGGLCCAAFRHRLLLLVEKNEGGELGCLPKMGEKEERGTVLLGFVCSSTGMIGSVWWFFIGDGRRWCEGVWR
ncbi:hypothetical protein HAX54_046922, partial [Datura stramonium]|nr:hypothetical protein [Datura stramonium]